MSDVKLGSVITGDSHRDAIHVAVAPVVAAENLRPGQEIGFVDEAKTAVGHSTKPLGIVDPYLKAEVRRGQQFYILLFQNTVTGMRHEWQHPDFPAGSLVDRGAAKQFVEGVAARVGLTFGELMDAAEGWARHHDYTYENTESYKDVPYETWREFWKQFEVLTGLRPDDVESHPFTCSC